MVERIRRLESTRLYRSSSVTEFTANFRLAVREAPTRVDGDINYTLLKALPVKVATFVKEKAGFRLHESGAGVLAWPEALQLVHDYFCWQL